VSTAAVCLFWGSDHGPARRYILCEPRVPRVPRLRPGADLGREPEPRSRRRVPALRLSGLGAAEVADGADAPGPPRAASAAAPRSFFLAGAGARDEDRDRLRADREVDHQA